MGVQHPQTCLWPDPQGACAWEEDGHVSVNGPRALAAERDSGKEGEEWEACHPFCKTEVGRWETAPGWDIPPIPRSFPGPGVFLE